MTTSIGSQPYSYYNVLNGNAAASPSASTTTLQQELVPSAAANSTGSTNTQTQNAVTPSSKSVLSPEVQALLQQILSPEATDEANPIQALLGGGSNSVNSLITGNSSSDSTNPLLSTAEKVSTSQIYASLLQAAYQGNAARTNAATSVVDDIFASTNAANLAYNAAIQQQTQTVLAANNFGPNGITPLTA